MGDKELCKYGAKCYQRNEAHRNRFSHPSPSAESNQNKRGSSPENSPNGNKRTRADDSPSSRATNGSPMQRQGSSSPLKISPKNGTNGANGTEKSNSPARETPVYTEEASTSTVGDRGSNPKRDHDSIGDAFDKESETRFSQRVEYKAQIATPSLFIKNKFLVEMPADFYAFWDFCVETAQGDQKPEKVFEKFGLKLVGPFDVLAGKFTESKLFEPGEYLRHWRYFYDPPEFQVRSAIEPFAEHIDIIRFFQTILMKEKTGIHYGYWRDEPTGECFVARNDVAKGCEISIITDNVFSAVM